MKKGPPEWESGGPFYTREICQLRSDAELKIALDLRCNHLPQGLTRLEVFCFRSGMRRKGERPIPKTLDGWSDSHPVAHAIRTGSYWFEAWLGQKSTPLATLSRKTGMSQARISAISQGDRISRAEVDALAIAWNVSAGDLIASMPDASIVVE